MQDEKPKLNVKQEAAIVALVKHGQVEKAAKEVGVNASTVHRWLLNEDFAKRYREAQATAWSNALESLKGASNDAIATLRANLKAKRISDRNTAARAILEFGARFVQLFDHEERLAAVEAALAKSKR